MHHNRSHPLLEQVPLTVSPFVSLPAATTLSYNYKTMPSNIPPSSLGISAASDDPASQPKAKYVVSGSGHSAHPDDIMASCRALQEHLTKMQDDAERELKGFEERIRERELAEKRRVAPGWLDSEMHLLQPESSSPALQKVDAEMPAEAQAPKDAATADDQGAELDRAFGGMGLK